MLTFKDYLKKESDQQLLSTDNDEENSLRQIITLAWKKHLSKTKQFLKELSKIDPEIKRLFQKLDNESSAPSLGSDQKGQNSDTSFIRPPVADTGYGLTDEN
jgi:CO dehydrogenase nickel-insertion accessory protein CooC1